MTCASTPSLSVAYNLQEIPFCPLDPVNSVRVVNFGGGILTESPTAKEA
jgi:hypothetical protein